MPCPDADQTTVADDNEATTDHAAATRSATAGVGGSHETLIGTDTSTLTSSASPVGVVIEPPTGSGARFQIVRPHARGGIGVVFVALDAELRRDVALKQIRPERADDPVSRARFLLEAEITGRLEHPGIVPVYGLGADSCGRPFYAMRFVRGESLKDAINAFHDADSAPDRNPGERALALRGLLSRFLDVCNAVAYAHSRGVIHRDIKPANILLGPFGETLLVDWGLAKVLGVHGVTDDESSELPMPSATASGSSETLAGSAIGTPAFMSPEQAEGDLDKVGLASDIYSLGATLFVLLAGRPPVEGDEVAKVLEAVVRGDIRRPREANPRVDRPMEAVILKAMARDTAHRYESARALASEVEQWLAGEPVSAYREPWTARVRRWMRRHRMAVTGAAAALVVAVVGLAVIVVQEARSQDRLAAQIDDLHRANDQALAARVRAEESSEEARRARVRAEGGFNQARQAVDESLTKIAQDDRLATPGLQPLRRELLSSALRFYQDFLAKRGDDPSLRREVGRAHTRVGEITALTDSHAAAMLHFERGRALLTALAAERPADHGVRSGLANVENFIGTSCLELGRLDAAEAAYARADSMLEALSADRPDLREYQVRRARALANLGVVRDRANRVADSLKAHESSLAILERLVANEPGDESFHYELAQGLIATCHVRLAEGQTRRALDAAVQGAELLAALDRAHPGSTLYAPALARGLATRGFFERITERREQALASYERARATWLPLIGENPKIALYRTEMATLDNMLSDLQRDLGRLDEATDSARRASSALERLLADDPSAVANRRSLAKSQDNIGRLMAARGQADEALAAFARAIDLLEHLPDRGLFDDYNLCCDRALSLPLLSGDPARREREAKAAVADARRAIVGGFRNLEHLRRDPDLDPLRDRADFQAVLLDLAFPRLPFAR